VNGMDFFAVRDAMKEVTDYVRSGKGPHLVEFKTYRYRGHSMSDPGNYRSKEEVSQYKQKHDPINNFKEWGLKNNLVTEAELKKIEKDIKTKITDSIEFAEHSSEPLAEELWTDVYR